MITLQPVSLRYLGGAFPGAEIPKGTTVTEARNIPKDENGMSKFWVDLSELPQEIRDAYSQTGILLSMEDVCGPIGSRTVVVDEEKLAVEFPSAKDEMGIVYRKFQQLNGPAMAGSFTVGSYETKTVIRPATVADFERFRVSGPEYYGITE